MSYNYFPKLSQLVTVESLPEQLNFIQGGIENLLDGLAYRNLRARSSQDGCTTSYVLDIISFKKLKYDILGTGLVLVLNPDFSTGTSVFPVSLTTYLGIRKYIKNFNLAAFSYTPQDFLNLAMRITNFTNERLLYLTAINFCTSLNNPFNELATTLHDSYGLNITLPVSNDPETAINEIINAAHNTQGFILNAIIAAEYIIDITSINNSLDNIKRLFSLTENVDIIATIKKLFIPKIFASLNNLSLALSFPRTWLKPIDTNTGEAYEDENIKSMLRFNVGSLHFSTENGFRFENESAFSFDKSEIGNTGLTLYFDNMKLDLSRTSNIPEAAAAGYPDDFVGVFVESAEIGLPKKWFSDNNSTLNIVGSNLLIGTGGISGTIGIEAGSGVLSKKIGGENGFEVTFNSFDITFRQGAITESNIQGKLKIPKFQDSSDQPLEIDVTGHISQNGDFNLTASVPNGIQAHLFNFVNFDFHTFELGREEDNFYLGTSCDVWFSENSAIGKIIGGQKISLPKVRIYSNGRMEIVGGTAFIPSNISLHLGPVDISVTGINFGSHQQNGRQYNYWGFDGAISINPLGIDVRGEGLKYYYTVDNDSYPNDDGDSFVHIQTLEVDLIIPGTATPATAAAMIHGMLSIPNPGVSQEYTGAISLKLPKFNIAGSAGMRMMPKEPAFIVDAALQLPAPIPIGFIAIYGFRALLGYRYVAEREAVGLTSDNTWYDYYKYPPRGVDISKFSPPNKTKDYSVPFALGAGAVLGTSFDNGNIISARVMVLLSLPTLFMIDGKASLLSARLGLNDTKEPPFFAFVAWGDDTIEAGLGADFKLPQDSGSIISLYAAVESRFPLKGGAWYVRMGTKDKPVSATLFKNVLNLNAKAYLTLSSQGIEVGAGVSFNLSKDFGVAKARLYAWVEVGGFISFERPQLGGYIYFGGGIEVNVWKLIYIGAELSVYLAAEVPKPFKIHAKVTVKGKIKVLFFSIKFNVTVSLTWETNSTVDTTPICPLPYAGVENRANELVKAVHMLTNEAYDLNFFTVEPNASKIIEIDAVIPIDSYIDIKTAKGLIIKNVSAKIGGGTIPPANYMDKIPPKAIVQGKVLRQVVHEYSIEQIKISAWDETANQWVAYHPFAALAEDGAERIEAAKCKIGSWQLINNQYDTLRLLATNPFSYTDAGEPGWVVPEYHGITGELLFCEETVEMKILNFGNKKNTDEGITLQGKDFWVAFGENAILPINIIDLQIMIAATHAAIVTFTFTADGSSYSFPVAAGSVYTRILKSGEKTNVYSNVTGVSNKSLHITSNEPVSVYVLNYAHSGQSTDATNLFPTTTLGTEYYQVSYGNYDSYMVIAVEDNTMVYENGTSIAVLQAGQIYYHREPVDITGRRITANKPIACFVANQGTYIPSGVGLPSMLFQQLPPVNEWGMNFFVPVSIRGVERVRIVASQNGTTITQTGGTVMPGMGAASLSLNAGQFVELEITLANQGCFITADKPVGVCSFMMSGILPVGGPSITWIPPIAQSVNSAIMAPFIHSTNNPLRIEYYALLVVATAHKDQTTMATSTANPGPLSGGTWHDHPSGYSFYSVPFTNFNVPYYFANPEGLLAWSYGIRLPDSYYYLFGTGMRESIIEQEEDRVYRYNPSNHHYIKGAWFNLAEEYPEDYPWQSNGVALNTFAIKHSPDYPHNLERSLYFLNYNRLLIMLPEESVDVALLLTTESPHVKIRYYKGDFPDGATQVQYAQVDEVVKTQGELSDPVCYSDSENPIIKIIIEPIHPNIEATDCCTTSLQELRWLSVDKHQYSQQLLTADEIEDEHKAMVKAVNKYIQPVWRPETKYCIHFQLKDTVSYNGSKPPGVYDYYYGFKTSGSLGHYSQNAIGEGLNLLEKYIDFDRSYPNADGNLLQSKPLFWGHEECKINIFFNKPFAYHLLNNWPEYGNLQEIGGSLNVKIKDPVSEILIEYPLPIEITEVPQAEGNGEDGLVWKKDENPPVPAFAQLLNNLIVNDEHIPCDIAYMGALELEAAMSYSVTLTNLKPLKLYTALFYNAFNPNGTELSDAHNVEVHRFVFQTSRYAGFEEQVKSCILKDEEENEQMAVFELSADIPSTDENNIYEIVWNPDNNILPLFYAHDFDKLTEGLFCFKPLEAALTTEFNIIRNEATGNVIAVLVRNPEPFNDPKLPLEEVADTILVVDAGGNVNAGFKTLYSKDYSQAIISKDAEPITENNLFIRFRYKLWDGAKYNVEQEETIQVEITINQ